MECLYIPKYNENEQFFKVPIDEANHLKALRLRLNNNVMVSDGQGNLYITNISKISEKDYYLSFSEKKSYSENNSIDLAIGLLKHRDRFEFAVEKSTELGVNRIFPLITDFTEKNSINTERLESKIVAALKQSKNPFLPKIENLTKINEINFNNYKSVVLADISGNSITKLQIEPPVLILIGPEGGFSKEELSKLSGITHLKKLYLGQNRLRTETAAIITLNMMHNKLNNL